MPESIAAKALRPADLASEQTGLGSLRDLILDALREYVEPAHDPALTHGNDWWSPLWQVVRAAKSHHRLRDLDGYGAWRIVRRAVNVEDLQSADSRLADEADVATAWADAHDRIRYLPGETLLERALEFANAYPVAGPRDRGPFYARFLSLLAGYTRLRQTDDPINKYDWDLVAAPVQRWAEILGVQPNTMSAWRRWAVKDGILAPHTPHSHAGKRAAQYTVSLDRLLPVRGRL